jgi:hypothetical protein
MPKRAMSGTPNNGIAVDGDIAAKDCLLRYKSGGRVLAVASIYRDLANLQAELATEQQAEP